MTEHTELAGKLQEAQVQFLLQRLQGDGLAATVDRELTTLWQWGEGVTLNQIVDRELLITTIIRWVETAPQKAELRAMVAKTVMHAIQAELNDGATIQNLVPKQEYDKIVGHYAKFEKIRADIIRLVLESPIYSELITDVLYHGIKDYLTTENAVVKKVPGMGALMKAGAKSINKAMPGLENAAEGTIKKFINGNLRSTVELSEKILNNALSEGSIKNIADHFWKTISDKEFGHAKNYVSEADIDSTIALGESLWSEVRKAEYLHNLIRQIVVHVLDEQGDRPLAELVNEIGYSQEYLTGEVKQVLSDVLAQKLLWQYLEERIRSNVAEFYQSDAFASAMK